MPYATVCTMRAQYRWTIYSMVLWSEILLHAQPLADDVLLAITMYKVIRNMPSVYVLCTPLSAPPFPPVHAHKTHNSLATDGFTGLSHRSSHYEERSNCLNKFTKIYNGTLHLHYTHAVITSIG